MRLQLATHSSQAEGARHSGHRREQKYKSTIYAKQKKIPSVCFVNNAPFLHAHVYVTMFFFCLHAAINYVCDPAEAQPRAHIPKINYGTIFLRPSVFPSMRHCFSNCSETLQRQRSSGSNNAHQRVQSCVYFIAHGGPTMRAKSLFG